MLVVTRSSILTHVRVAAAATLLASSLQFLWGAFMALGNYYFAWAPDKLSVEWESTLTLIVLSVLTSSITAFAGLVLLDVAGPVSLLAPGLVGFCALWLVASVRAATTEPLFLYFWIGLPLALAISGMMMRQYVRSKT